MTCCLNPACHNPPHSESTTFCSNCRFPLIVLRNRYRPIQLLGNGGFGKTYLAEDLDKLNEYCVIKQFAPRVQGTAAINKATELFEQEARRLQQLGEHPQIPTLLAYFEEENNLYLVQQFIDGQNLLAELKQQGTFNAEKIWEVLLDLLNILKTVHQHQVIHRDIKPENIIRRSTDNKLVLIDFGISKQLTMTVINNPGTIIGSPGYAPLEQMQDGKAYPASDLYSLGATCFHLLSGIHPWIMWEQQGYGWVSSWRQHLQQPQSSELEKILDKLLQKDYQQRYQSAEEVLQDFSSPLPSLSPVHPTEAVVITHPPSSFPATLPHQPQPGTSPAPVKPKVALQKASRQNTNFRKRLLVGAAITIVGTQIYGYVRYGLFPTSPIFLVESFPSSFFLEKTLKGHSNPVDSVAISPDGNTLASGSWDKTIKLWNLATGEQIRTFSGHSDTVNSVAFSPNGNTLASGSWDKTIKLWNLATGEQIRTLKVHSNTVISVAFSPDGNTLASGSSDKTIKLWNLATGEQIRTFSGHSDTVNSVAFSPDGKTLVSGSDDKTIKLWNLATGEEIRTLTGHSYTIYSVAFSPDGKTLASGSDDNTIKLWNLATGEEIRTLTGHSYTIWSVAFSPDGNILASGSRDNTIKLWNLATGEQIRTLTGHDYEVISVAISPDGKTLASGSGDNTIKIWRLK
ncbi:serine/threonine protein kinase [Calothrix sp. FACHB-1219]|uniref:serine/threonine-protein kinase n=1 Tax=unclassified Calothrix TaxID=2619626 RepID=UPI0016825683|nr:MULTISPECIES: serine/threonine-protein kinase [unclassified Calothrix]MBD2205328.1 serine/threonine protein kinase [Calothrix sp. FACHB-168]MBD2218459.1 serine/threonine protein kinase [Calothrix sp. FACHB-1219]